MKRSRQLALILMGQVPFLLVGCEEQVADTQQLKEGFYTSVDACIADGNPTDNCHKAYDSAQQNHAKTDVKFSDRDSCYAQFGDRCNERHEGGGSIWVPLMEGFMLSQILRPNYPPTYAYASPVYRQRDGQYARSFRDDEDRRSSSSGFSSGGGVGSSTSRSTSATTPVTSSPNRAITVSRSGFGSSAAARGAWGGSHASLHSSGGSSSSAGSSGS
ncbi:DUF1190 domain-containing protein [Pseudolysobacter antarcticus]|uniref:DUF1190 domain-containing protein n=1 Tax=Pseudolysobacter antarcticus TaxID=2511995 RepID=A0A411HGX5_9GAMM|nr:DUF1190 domain-containing protein [Pseudolysobacter antarcticus]QBB69739.1 DUF1190 domain-containing protein [Pseudolysobacter antarcticus]